MGTSFHGTFVISWAQTELDGVTAATPDCLNVGATWRWTGEAVRVDNPSGLLVLEGSLEEASIRKRAAKVVRRLMGAAIEARPIDEIELEDDGEETAQEHGFVVTDGRRSFAATIVSTAGSPISLLMFIGEVPPADTDLWVVRITADTRALMPDERVRGGVICFTPGTLILAEDGYRPIESLHCGDRVQTADNGLQPILWTGQRHMSGARLHAFPHLRPVRLRAGALGLDRPDADLLVSPQHRMLVRGGAARILFNSDEVLVAAGDLINDRTILVDHTQREVTYIHLLLEQHQIIFANGLETESFHPSATSLDTIDDGQRQALFDACPSLQADPLGYGDFARRNLSTSEAAILRYGAA